MFSFAKCILLVFLFLKSEGLLKKNKIVEDWYVFVYIAKYSWSLNRENKVVTGSATFEKASENPACVTQ